MLSLSCVFKNVAKPTTDTTNHLVIALYVASSPSCIAIPTPRLVTGILYQDDYICTNKPAYYSLCTYTSFNKATKNSEQ